MSSTPRWSPYGDCVMTKDGPALSPLNVRASFARTTAATTYQNSIERRRPMCSLFMCSAFNDHVQDLPNYIGFSLVAGRSSSGFTWVVFQQTYHYTCWGSPCMKV